MNTQANIEPGPAEIAPGAVAGWIQHGGPNWGVIEAVAADRVVVRGANGQKKLPPTDLSVVVAGTLASVVSDAQADAAGMNPNEIWRALLAGFGQDPFSVGQARTFLALSEARDPGLWLALWGRPEYFARAGRTRFRVRSESEMRSEQQRIEQRRREEHVLGKLDEWMERHRDGSAEIADVLAADDMIRRVACHMVYGDDVPELSARGRKSIEVVLAKLHQDTNPAWPLTFFLAQQLDDSDPWASGEPRLVAHRRWLADFAQDPAICPPVPVPELPLLEPQTALWAIDDQSTVERDDAIGVSVSASEWIVEIAIADVSAGQAVASAVLDRALDVATTIYLPTRNIPMLPSVIGATAHSLQTKEPRPVFLLRLRLDPATGAPLGEPELERGRLPLAGIADYDSADTGKTAIVWWSDALEITEMVHQRRMTGGAEEIRVPDVMIEVTDGHPVGYKEMKPWLGARAVIREMMILANAAFATILKKHKLPAPFRAMTRRGNGMVAKVDYRPGTHAGLGVDAYVYASSPIRRFSDILAQIQLASIFGSTPLDIRAMQRWIAKSESAFNASRRWMDMAQRYWKLRYLEAHPDMTLTARVEPRGAGSETSTRVRLLPLGLVVHVPQALTESDRVRSVRLQHVDAECDELRVTVES